MPTFWRVYEKWVLNFVESLFCLCWDDHMVFILQLTWCITLSDLWILKNLCITAINPTWSCCMILLLYCWIWFASIGLAKKFVSFHKMLWKVNFLANSIFHLGFLHLYLILTCNICVCVWYLCLVLVSGWWWLHRLSLGVFLPLQFFRRASKG